MNFKKKLILFTMLSSLLNLSYAMQNPQVLTDEEQQDAISKLLKIVLYSSPQIKMPSSATLNKRLTEMGLQDFFEKTEIRIISDQMKFPNEIPTRVEMHLREYDNTNPSQALAARAKKEAIVRSILKDHPQAIVELENEGIIKKQ
jgi:hypothetical protein